MSEKILREILMDNNCFYLGTVIDGARQRGIDPKGFIICPDFARHIIYMRDTNLMLSMGIDSASPEELEDAARETLNANWEVSFHELGDVVQGILQADMSYLDWSRLAIINEPEPEIIRNIFLELNNSLEDIYLALIGRLIPGATSDWLPLDYRWAQMTSFARTGKIDVNYFTILGQLHNEINGHEVYPNALAEIKYQRLADQLRRIELNARRGIL